MQVRRSVAVGCFAVALRSFRHRARHACAATQVVGLIGVDPTHLDLNTHGLRCRCADGRQPYALLAIGQ